MFVYILPVVGNSFRIAVKHHRYSLDEHSRDYLSSSLLPIEGHFSTVFGKFEPKNVVGHRADPINADPCVTARVLSHCVSKSIHGSLQ